VKIAVEVNLDIEDCMGREEGSKKIRERWLMIHKRVPTEATQQ
jgi:hypothetical protein